MPSKSLPILASLVAVSLCAALVSAQEAPSGGQTPAAAGAPGEEKKSDNARSESGAEEKPPARPRASKPAATAAVPLASPEGQGEPTPKPRHRSFFEWLFGSRKAKPTPTPVASSATPTPGPRHGTHKPASTPAPEPGHTVIGKATPTPHPSDKPVHGQKPVKPPETTPKPEKPESTPKPEKPHATPKPDKAPEVPPAPEATPVPKKGKGKNATPAPSANPNRSLPPDANADADADAKEKARFEAARAKANEDPQIRGLKTKADDATTDTDSKAALKAYNKALFEKIKKIDPSLRDYVDSVAAAMMRRLSE